MNSGILRTAEPLKCKIIDFFMAKTDNVIIGNEIMYGTKRKVVDLLLVEDNSISAIEIKGDNDNLKLLYEQITEYSKIFDYIYVFSTKRHENNLIEILPQNIGLYIITENSIRKVRKAKKIKEHDKLEMLYSINCRYLQSKGIKTGKNSDDIRFSVSKKSITWTHSMLINFYIDKLSKNYATFKKERGIISHVDDIPLLNGGLLIAL